MLTNLIDDDGNTTDVERDAFEIGRRVTRIAGKAKGFVKEGVVALTKRNKTEQPAPRNEPNRAQITAQSQKNEEWFSKQQELIARAKSAAHEKAYQDIMKEPEMTADHPECGMLLEDRINLRAGQQDVEIIDDIGVVPQQVQPEPTLKPKVVRKRVTGRCR